MTNGAVAPLRILVVAAGEPWPLSHGGHLRLYNFLKRLGRDTRVTLAVPAPASNAAHMPPGVRVVPMTGAALPAQPTATPPLTIRLARRHFGCNQDVVRWLTSHATPDQYDVAFVFGFANGHYVDALQIPAVWDVVDDPMLYLLRDALWQPLATWPRALTHAALYALTLRHVAQRCAAIVLTSPVDASYARRYVGDARVAAITNGVDLDYFAPSRFRPDPGTVAFVGGLYFPPNIEAATRFARRVWPHIHANSPVRRFLLVGRNPVPQVRDLARIRGVELHTDVPDVRPYLEQAAVVVVPTRLGGGVKNKVLEACALRRPVVASPQALAGLTAIRGADLLCATDDTSWVRQVTRLLENPEQAACIAGAGLRWVRQAHNWSAVGDELLRLLRDAGLPARSTVPTPLDIAQLLDQAKPAPTAAPDPAHVTSSGDAEQRRLVASTAD